MMGIDKHARGGEFSTLSYSLVILSCILCTNSFSQLTPPGLGSGTNIDSWMAAGFREQLDSAGTNELLTYVGHGRESSRTDYNPLHLQGILVLNSEWHHRFSPKWQGSLAGSYRRQNEYENETPEVKQEFRIYGRFSHSYNFSRIKFTQTLRQEVRRFYTARFHNWEKPFQLRTRFRLQAAYTFGKTKHHLITAGAEALFVSDRETGKWTPFAYSETRVLCFYSYRFSVATLSIGYMNDMLGYGTSFKDNHYFSVDIVFENLLGRFGSRLVRFCEAKHFC